MSPHLMQLLFVVRTGGTLDPLLRRGLEYHQIVQLIQDAVANGLLQYNGNKLLLTEQGNESLSASPKTSLESGPDIWIVPDLDAEITPRNKWAVYFPKKSWRPD